MDEINGLDLPADYTFPLSFPSTVSTGLGDWGPSVSPSTIAVSTGTASSATAESSSNWFSQLLPTAQSLVSLWGGAKALDYQLDIQSAQQSAQKVQAQTGAEIAKVGATAQLEIIRANAETAVAEAKNKAEAAKNGLTLIPGLATASNSASITTIVALAALAGGVFLMLRKKGKA